MSKLEKDNHPDFRRIFEGLPAAYLVLSPEWIIVAASDAYLNATKTKREDIINKKLFDVFPDNPDDPDADGVQNLTFSLEQVLRHKSVHTMAVQKYDIPSTDAENKFEERWWRPQNSPILSETGEVLYIVHHVEDVTNMMDVLEGAMDKTEGNTNNNRGNHPA